MSEHASLIRDHLAKSHMCHMTGKRNDGWEHTDFWYVHTVYTTLRIRRVLVFVICANPHHLQIIIRRLSWLDFRFSKDFERVFPFWCETIGMSLLRCVFKIEIEFEQSIRTSCYPEDDNAKLHVKNRLGRKRMEIIHSLKSNKAPTQQRYGRQFSGWGRGWIGNYPRSSDTHLFKKNLFWFLWQLRWGCNVWLANCIRHRSKCKYCFLKLGR